MQGSTAKDPKQIRTVAKAARLLLLYRLRESGAIDDTYTLQEIGNLLGVHRSTILRDFRVLDKVKSEYIQLLSYILTRVAKDATPHTYRVEESGPDSHTERQADDWK